MVPIYEFFARHWKDCLNFDDTALLELYEFESMGKGSISPDNGFAVGKKWMDVAVAQWREDMWRTLWPWELYEDPDLLVPDWWLDKVLGPAAKARVCPEPK